MARVRDRTEDFKDTVRHSARSLGYDEAKLASIMASFIIHKPRQRSSFTKAAIKTLESIGELEQFLLKHRKDYTDLHRTTEQERDSIEHEVSAFIKTCQEQIDVLKNSINDEEANSKGWLGIGGANSNADTIAHKHGVVLILSERLHSVTSQFDQLRAIRFQDAINRAIPRRKLNRVTRTGSAETSKFGDLEPKEPDELRNEPLRVQQQLLDDETRALQVELTSLLDAVQETETKMVEMSALNHLMSTHVLQQTQQIELLYEQAVEATKNVVLGNKELSQAIQRNNSIKCNLALLFDVTYAVAAASTIVKHPLSHGSTGAVATSYEIISSPSTAMSFNVVDMISVISVTFFFLVMGILALDCVAMRYRLCRGPGQSFLSARPDLPRCHP